MTYKLSIELVILRLKLNLDIDQNWSLVRHHDHSNNNVSKHLLNFYNITIIYNLILLLTNIF